MVNLLENVCFSSNSKVFIETLKRFSTCDCSEHASFEEVVWSETAFYTEFLAKAMIQGAKCQESFESLRCFGAGFWLGLNFWVKN